MLLHDFGVFDRTIKRHRARGWGWRYDGVEDWPTEKIFEQLRDIGIDTDAQRFPQQAATAGRFARLGEEWVRQIPKKKRETELWADFPLIGIPVLWERLAPQVLCADLVEEHLYRVVNAEESEEKLPDVDGLPAGLAAALELARFLQAVEPSQRFAQFDELERRRYCDYFEWVSELIQKRGAEFPDAVTEIADSMSDCRDGNLLQSDLALALALAGRHDEAIARTRANIERFSESPWVRILAGDVFEELGDDDAAIRQWLEALPMASLDHNRTAAADRLKEAYERAGRRIELEKILSEYPDPDPQSEHDLPPAISFPKTPPAANLLDFDDTSLPDFSPPPRLTSAPKIGRNDPCPCGSGKKYKKCCIT